jgi:L-ascorbate metabolism protein UlaG (beta-lactamase superfamily)
MHIRLIRHATIQINMGGRRFLLDPMLAAPGTLRSLTFGATAHRNPLAPLPCPVAELLAPDAIIVTHTHFDHCDPEALRRLPKQIPVICQPTDQARLQQAGFTHVQPVGLAPLSWQNFQIVRARGAHGRGLLGLAMGRVSGFVLQAPSEPVLYIAGDTIWCPAVQAALKASQPDIIVLNTGAAQFNLGAPITMTAADVVAVCQAAPAAQVIAVHLEAVNHCRLTRAALAAEVAHAGAAKQVRIPQDGELLAY